MSLVRIEYLADEGSLERGRDYFRRGKVLRATILADGTIEGVVEGENFYRVRLTARTWSCDCPMGVQGVFCKHCVAVALKALGEADAAAPPSRSAATSTTGLADAQKQLLDGFRTRRELYDWRAVSDYAGIAYASVEGLRDAAQTWGAAALIPTVHKAIASTVRVIHRADDSNGEIGTIVRELLDLHAELCAIASPPPTKLADWLIDFQFDGKQDFFNPDVALYADALGEKGLARFDERLRQIEGKLPPPSDDYDDRTMVRYNFERLAVARRDVAGIIASFGELTRSYRLHDLAKALVEVGAIDEAIAFAERGTHAELGWQAERCGQYWCELLHENRSRDEELAARTLIFERWPTAQNAQGLAAVAGDGWATLAEDAYAKLEKRDPSELINALLGLGLDERAWNEAHRFTLHERQWTRLVAAREKVDPASVVPVLRELIDTDLQIADARNYKSAAKRLKQLRAALKATGAGDEFEPIVAALREEHRRRPRLLEELRKAGF